MKVAFDASFLVLLLNSKTPASVERAAERVEGLVESLSGKRAKVIIPTPALTEILMGARGAAEYIEAIRPFSCFQVRAFDEKAAVELASRLGDHIKKNRNKRFKKAPPWNKIKFDRQIVAIAKSQGAQAVYSDDKQLRSFAIECGMDAFQLSDIPIPPKQEKLSLEATTE